MQPILDVKQMTLPEKLGLMETLWDELCRREEDVPVPEWHQGVLDERIREVDEGRAEVSDWDDAKARIARRIT